MIVRVVEDFDQKPKKEANYLFKTTDILENPTSGPLYKYSFVGHNADGLKETQKY